MSHRKVDIITRIEPVPAVYIPEDVLQKVIDGLIKNAIENTPDKGKVEITLQKNEMSSELRVHDYGVGITEESQARIFEGFFSTQETMDYSSKRPFDFNAGGKGADLLRMKIFSEKYDFNIELSSTRCRYIPKRSDYCPGNIIDCTFCKENKDCYESGETTAIVSFPQRKK
jgi:light-regulated signal transduction histidine kinase (bacteriophytochrome)